MPDPLGKTLWDLMTDRDWTQSDLARASGVPRGDISAYIAARTFPNDENLDKLASALGVSRAYLLGRPNAAD